MKSEKLNKKNGVFLRLVSYAKPYWGRLLAAVFMVLIITGIDLYRTIILGEVVDIFVAETGYELVTGKALIYLGILVLICLLVMAESFILQYTGQKIIVNIREEVFRHIERLSLRFFDITPVGKLVTRVTNDVEALNEMFANILAKLFRNSVRIIALAVVMLRLNTRLALYAFALLPFVFGLTYCFKKISRACYRITRTRLTSINIYLSEHISGMKLIQSFGREEVKNTDFRGKCAQLFEANFREIMVFAVFRPAMYILSILAMMTMLGIGSNFVYQDIITIGTLYVFVQYIGSFFEPIQELAEQIGTLQQAMASAEKIFTVLDDNTIISDPENPAERFKAYMDPDDLFAAYANGKKPEDCILKGSIEFDHVWFAYAGEDYVLRDVSFTIKPGEKVAFVGATGAGKSSILNLIGRYYEINKGRILIDGIDIRDIPIPVLRKNIGQVLQDVFIFTGNIRENISLGNPMITEEQIIRSAKIANADSFIDRLPKGYDEPVTERGSTLSAGQRQLLSFARTLAYDPAILVMDEATANVDTETESLIEEALERLMSGRTTIMVAHRLSTISGADRIMVMHKGKIRETGTHAELLAMNGIYKKLYEIQRSTV